VTFSFHFLWISDQDTLWPLLLSRSGRPSAALATGYLFHFFDFVEKIDILEYEYASLRVKALGVDVGAGSQGNISKCG